VAESISQVKNSIEKRLKELRAEQSALESALSALGGVSAGGRRAAGRTRAKAGTAARSTRSRTRRRGRRGSRSAQALALVKAQPGITIPAMAKEMGIAAPYLYRVLPKLAEERKVRKDGSGWHPAKG
jgi:hypothetical protein